MIGQGWWCSLAYTQTGLAGYWMQGSRVQDWVLVSRLKGSGVYVKVRGFKGTGFKGTG